MANFKVGQRVRMLRGGMQAPHPRFSVTGKEATIIGPLQPGRNGDGSLYLGYPVDVDGVGRLNSYGNQMISPPENMAPLTDPKADEFLERIKKLKPYDEPKAPAEIIPQPGYPGVVRID